MFGVVFVFLTKCVHWNWDPAVRKKFKKKKKDFHAKLESKACGQGCQVSAKCPPQLNQKVHT